MNKLRNSSETEDANTNNDTDTASIEFDDEPDQIDQKKSRNKNFLKKLPIGTKAANILIGEVDYLDEEVFALVRLDHPVVLGKLTEVPISSKFFMLLLGPKDHNMIKYRYIGKSLVTLFSDEVKK
jgi:hypothetical protein